MMIGDKRLTRDYGRGPGPHIRTVGRTYPGRTERVIKQKEESMRKSIWYVVVLVAMMAGLFMLPASGSAKSVYIGGTMSLTGPYAEDSAAVLAGFEDYVKYVNDTKMMAPWRKEKWPSDIPVELLWRDDELKPAKALSIYEELKAKGILVYRASGSPIALALKDRLKQDNMG